MPKFAKIFFAIITKADKKITEINNIKLLKRLIHIFLELN